MNTETKEYERAREAAAQVRCLHCDEYSHHKQSCLITPNVTRFCPEALSTADEFLSIKGIAILSDDQSSPKIYNQAVYTESNRMTERAFLKANFKKVI